MSWKPANQAHRLPHWVPKWLRAPLRWLIKWTLVGAVIFLMIGIFYFYLSLKFDLEGVAEMPERSVILDRHGEVYGYVHGERRRLITRDEIPEVMVDALRAREDLRFFKHTGVDVKGLARATLRNIKDGSFTQGASTLTMQLARNSYNMRAKSLHRKFLEIALTLRIESRYSKDEILTHYLNRIYFGSGCHGVEEASQTYFGRSVSELNTGECALLVGIIRGPHVFSPLRNKEGATAQRDEVLARMVTCGLLRTDEKERALEDPIRLLSEQEWNRNSSYARESIRQKLNLILDQHDIRSGGLRIDVTIDGDMQKRSEELIKEPLAALESRKELQAAVVKMDPKTGGILALCGGRDYQKSPFNRAYLAKRDLGPAYRPFLEACALERSKVVISNQPVQTGRQLGVKETIRLSRRLGFSGPYQKTEDLYRGAIGASPMEVAEATAILLNEGEEIEPHIISKITDSNNVVVYQFAPSVNQAISKRAARSVIKNLKSDSFQVVSCTGSCRDGWAISLREHEATVIWLGYDEPKKIASGKVLKASLSDLLDRFIVSRP